MRGPIEKYIRIFLQQIAETGIEIANKENYEEPRIRIA